MFTGVHPLVSATRILIALVAMNYQLTVYQNDVFAKKTNDGNGGTAMILPVPGNGNIRMVDFSSYSNVFDDLNIDNNMFDGIATLGPHGKEKQVLPIQRVGDYDVSIAKNLEELQQLDWSFFKLDATLVETLRLYYGKTFGFCIARINHNTGQKPHPLAYIHEIEDNGRLFVPTRHEGHDSLYDNVFGMDAKSIRYMQSLRPAKNQTKWDHTIFVYGPRLKDNYHSPTHRHRNSKFSVLRIQHMLDKIDETFTLVQPSAALLNRMDFVGYLKNEDLWIPVEKVKEYYFDKGEISCLYNWEIAYLIGIFFMAIASFYIFIILLR